ncbi:MAG: HemK2/MTQ2 family protein methyltransferase [Candidatus Woesearchaeota archaeon]
MLPEKTYTYEPAEDTFLILDFIEKNKNLFCRKRVLELGTGSALIAVKCAELNSFVTASDINPYAIKISREKHSSKNIRFVVSNLFENIKQRFDIIIFNPPYLPEQKGEEKEISVAVCGGKKGYELIERFLSKMNHYLKDEGFCLLVFSSLTKKDVVDELIIRNGFFYEELSSKNVLFETLYLYSIAKQDFLKNKKLKSIKFLSKGKRSVVYKATLKNKSVAVKVLSRKTTAKNAIEREFLNLKLLNKFDIGPRAYFKGNDYVVMELVTGTLILDFFRNSNKKDAIKIIRELIRQCLVMDFLGINKEEFCNPAKHIFVKRKRTGLVVKIIDFERAHNSKKLKNLTQFLQFLTSLKSREALKNKFKINVERIRKISREHKRSIAEKRDFDEFEDYFDKISRSIIRCFL